MKNNNVSKSEVVSNVFVILFAILFIISLFRVMYNNELLTFTGLLETLSDAPTITLPAALDYTITADWGFFNFFRQFLNMFTSLFSVLVFVAAAIVQVVIYIYWILNYLFLI